MRLRLIFSAGLLAPLVLATLSPAQESAGLAEQGESLLEQSHLRAVHNQYLAVWQALDPEAASELGLHDQDSRLTSRDDANHRRIREAMERFLLRLRSEVRPERLSPSDRLDYDIFRSALEAGLFDFDREDARRSRPQDYLRLSGIFNLLQKDYAGPLTRASDAVSRLEQLPATLAQARTLLDRPPRLWTEQAILDCGGALSFFKELPRTMEPLYASDPLLQGRLKEALRKAREAVEEYRTFLKEVLLSRSTGDFASGREAYDRILGERHQLALDAPQIERLGRREMRRALSLLKRTARSIDKKRKWWELLEEAGRERSEASQLLAAFRGELGRSYDQLIRRDLVSLPSEKVRLLETPAFLRSVTSLSAYVPPAPMDSATLGELYVTPPEPALPKEERDALLAQMYNLHEVQCAVSYEAWPGRHLQHSLARRHSSPIRRWRSTPVFSDGWALYAEELAYEAGAFKSELTRLIQLRRRLLRAALAVLDVRLHTGGWSVEKGIDFLIDEARVPRLLARVEILRLTQEPTRGMCAIVGMSEILRLRDRLQRYFGPSFTLKEFHDRLLSYGTLSPRLIEGELERDWMRLESR